MVSELSPVPRLRAVELARAALSCGSLIALELEYQLETFAFSWILDPLADPSATLAFRRGEGRTREHEIDAACQALLASFPAVRAVVVEDELALRTDPIRTGCAFADERVVRWASVRSTSFDAARLCRAGSLGVPLCAYLVTRDPTALGLTVDSQLSSKDIGKIANATVAIMVPIEEIDGWIVVARTLPWR